MDRLSEAFGPLVDDTDIPSSADALIPALIQRSRGYKRFAANLRTVKGDAESVAILSRWAAFLEREASWFDSATLDLLPEDSPQ